MSATADPRAIRPSGPLTIADVVEFHSTIRTHLDQEGPVALDLSAVEQVDTAGLQAIVAAAKTGRVTVGVMSESVRQAAELVGLAAVVAAR